MLYLLCLLIQGTLSIIMSIILLPFEIIHYIYELFTGRNNPKYIAPSIVYRKRYFNNGAKTLEITDFHNNSFRVDCGCLDYYGTYNSLEEAKNKIDSICFEKEQGSLGEYCGFSVYKRDGMYCYAGKSTPYINNLLEYIEEKRSYQRRIDSMCIDLPF